MKGSELMIGDWVLDGTQIAQITSITCGGVIETTAHEISNIEVIEPIPLTADILESNGFVQDERHEYGVRDSYYNYLKVRCFADTYFEIGNAFDEEGELQAFADIQYVHELQHALKLCGIDKNIKL